MHWLAISLVLSVVLTVALNVALRLFPGANERVARGLERLTEDDREQQGPRVFVPWKAMLVASVVLTILANVILWSRG